MAVLIGGLKTLGLIARQLGLEARSWSAIGGLNDGLANFGFVAVGVFALCRIASATTYRWQRFGEPEDRDPASGPLSAA